ncbi:MAG: hypothetical protein ACPF9D_03105 [Owenweeksia sp.]
MKRTTFKSVILGLLGVAMLSSCEDYFGNKTDLGFIEVPEVDYREVAYVPILPVLSDFDRPVDVCVGFDELIYVVDETTEEVIAMDEAGRIIGRKMIPGAKAVAQDRRFDLLVIGRTDTAIPAGSPLISFTTVYRLRLLGNNGYGLNDAQVVKKIVHPFYAKSSFSNSDKQVQFNRITVIADANPARNNRYYVSRTGPSSSSLNPDDAIVWFDNNDKWISNISVNTSSGLFRDYFEDPNGISTLAQPPQLTAENGGDFIFTSLDPTNALKVQYIEFNEGEFGAEFRPRILASGGDTSKADGFINSPNRFRQPYDVTIAGDASKFIFIVDAETDSLYQFTATGLEGVLPPAATGITKYQKASFGGTGAGITQFNQPLGVAYFNEVLYVADAGNGRVLRFKLTTDFD